MRPSGESKTQPLRTLRLGKCQRVGNSERIPCFSLFRFQPQQLEPWYNLGRTDRKRSKLGNQGLFPCKFPCFREKSLYETASSANESYECKSLCQKDLEFSPFP